MKQTIKLITTLTLTCLGAGLLLAWVRETTREPIRQAAMRQLQEAIRQVIPETGTSPETLLLVDPADGSTNEVHVVFDRQGEWRALAIQACTDSGYSGQISLMAGFARDLEGQLTLSGIYVLRHAETPGLGAKIQDPDFRRHLAGRKVHSTTWKVEGDGGDIQAITAATVSSRAVLSALRQAIDKVDRLSAMARPGGIGPEVAE